MTASLAKEVFLAFVAGKVKLTSPVEFQWPKITRAFFSFGMGRRC
jgi:hypothetical protein